MAQPHGIAEAWLIAEIEKMRRPDTSEGMTVTDMRRELQRLALAVSPPSDEPQSQCDLVGTAAFE